MTIEERLHKTGKKALAALGLFFGIGFTAGFLTGFGYGHAGNQPPLQEEDAGGRSADAFLPALSIDVPAEPGEEDGAWNISDESGEFALTEHELGDDENGFYISGTVANLSKSAFDAVQIAFELCDAGGNPYATVTDRTTERMEPGDSWGFVVYIPYAEMPAFDSYRLQGVMGVRR